jgi:mannose-6-phosphate isomerase-like protein (cupin superfamily)
MIQYQLAFSGGTMEKINISEKLRTFDKYWQSKLVGEFNRQSVKLVKMKGEFDWHHHKTEDEFYLVLKGQISIEFGDDVVMLDEGDLFIIPGNTDHRIIAPQEASILMIEPKSKLNTDPKKQSNDSKEGGA